MISLSVTAQDIDNANQIFGSNLANLRGETTRTKPEHVQVEYVQIPQDFVQLHKYVTLVADVMCLSGLMFLVTPLRGLSLVTIEHLLLRTAKPLPMDYCPGSFFLSDSFPGVSLPKKINGHTIWYIYLSLVLSFCKDFLLELYS